MAQLHVVTDLDASVADVLAVSLDLDVEVAAGRGFGVRPVPAGPGSRTGGVIAAGETVRWNARVLGVVPVGHTSVIDEVVHDDGHGGAHFTDTMVRGAFHRFRHVHLLEPTPSGGCRMTDRMSWTSPFGPVGRLADAVFVRRTLAALLADRNAEIALRVRRAHGV